jgi:hypothetical protein
MPWLVWPVTSCPCRPSSKPFRAPLVGGRLSRVRPLCSAVAALIAATMGHGLANAQDDDEASAYGRRGSLHLGLGLGLGSSGHGAAFAGGVSFGYFVLTGLAPGADAEVSGGSGLYTTGLVTGTLRLVPIRTRWFAGFLIARAGRVIISSHPDLWGAGGGAGVICMLSGGMGVQLAYEVLALLPSSSCQDLSNGCRLDSLSLGFVIGL